MTIDELLKKGLLKEVKVQRPPDGVIEAGNQKSEAVIGHGIIKGKCHFNSICVIGAMREKGENDWDIVPGFAFNPKDKKPLLHVWVKKESRHYDPSWICYNWNPEDLDYYQMIQPLEANPSESIGDTRQRYLEWERAIHAEIMAFASHWDLKLLGYLP